MFSMDIYSFINIYIYVLCTYVHNFLTFFIFIIAVLVIEYNYQISCISINLCPLLLLISCYLNGYNVFSPWMWARKTPNNVVNHHLSSNKMSSGITTSELVLNNKLSSPFWLRDGPTTIKYKWSPELNNLKSTTKSKMQGIRQVVYMDKIYCVGFFYVVVKTIFILLNNTKNK